jgi:hypothetical protein
MKKSYTLKEILYGKEIDPIYISGVIFTPYITVLEIPLIIDYPEVKSVLKSRYSQKVINTKFYKEVKTFYSS